MVPHTETETEEKKKEEKRVLRNIYKLPSLVHICIALNYMQTHAKLCCGQR